MIFKHVRINLYILSVLVLERLGDAIDQLLMPFLLLIDILLFEISMDRDGLEKVLNEHIKHFVFFQALNQGVTTVDIAPCFDAQIILMASQPV